MVSVVIANLTNKPVIGSTAVEGRASTNAGRIGAHGSAVFGCVVEPEERSGRIIARSGEWSVGLGALSGAFVAGPPGLMLGPLWPALNLPAWVGVGAQQGGGGGGPVVVQPTARDACVGMLSRRPMASGGSEEWEVYIECNGATETDIVTVWFGPVGEVGARLRVGPGVREMDEGGRRVAAITREGDHWWSVIAVPSRAISGDGRLLIAVSREQEGRRWSWPRPLGPGQVVPSSGVVDVSRWRVVRGE